MSMINNALSGAMAAQAALNTNSQNIANAMTPGYSRQGVLLSAVQPRGSGINAAGAGVTVSSVLRFADTYKSLQMWQANSNLGQYKVGQSYLTQLEQVMSDDTSNVNQGLDAFFAALNAASVQPDSGPLREQVLTAADGLVKRVASLQQLFNNQQAAIDSQRGAVTTQINSFAHDIAALNKQIAAGQAAGVNTSGLKDARDQKIDQLAHLVGVQVVEQGDGTRNVSLKNGQPLVLGSEAGTLAMNAGALQLSLAGNSFKVQEQDLGGQLGGLHDFQQQTLEPLKQQIRDLSQGIAKAVNDTLSGAAVPPAPAYTTYDAKGVHTPGRKDLFAIVNGQLTLTDLKASELAFSTVAGTGGDSSNLKKLIGLKNNSVAITDFDARGNPTVISAGPPPVYQSSALVMGDVYTQLVGKLGVQSQQNQASQTTAQTVRDQSEENWKSTSGVNTDEEAINLMQFKQMYESNLKVVAVANQLFDSTLAMVG